jgi:hypothetical protein
MDAQLGIHPAEAKFGNRSSIFSPKLQSQGGADRFSSYQQAQPIDKTFVPFSTVPHALAAS